MPDQDKVQWGRNCCGAMLAAGAAGDVNPAIAVAASILEGSLAAGNQGLRAGSLRFHYFIAATITYCTDSVVEDGAVIGAFWTALNYTGPFQCLLLAFVILFIPNP